MADPTLVSNNMYVSSLTRFMADFKDTVNADATITITFRNRRFKGLTDNPDGVVNTMVNIFDEQTFTVGMKKGQKIDKVTYPGFEFIFINRIVCNSGVAVLCTNENRLGAVTYVKNGSNLPVDKSYNVILTLPSVSSILCEDCIADGNVQMHDPFYLDGRFWCRVAAVICLITLVMYIYRGNEIQLGSQAFKYNGKRFEKRVLT